MKSTIQVLFRSHFNTCITCKLFFILLYFSPEESPKFSIRMIWEDLKRLAKNRVLMFDSLAMAFFLLSTANRAYIAKFVEFQFNTSPSAASLFSGSSTMLGAISALAISILVISWFKPSARALALFNVLADVAAVLIGLSFIAVARSAH